MNSCLYECRVYHSRHRPKPHSFSYRLFMFNIDLDEEHELEKQRRLVSRSGWAPYKLIASDHYNAGKHSIKANICSYLESKGYDSQLVGKIFLLTHLRTFGHVFNPVSFYFVNDRNNQALCSVAEVGNTFNEQKLFLIEETRNGQFHENHRKQFYVSPFSDLDTTFHFNLKQPKETLRIGINQSEKANEKPYFKSALVGEARPLTDNNLLRYTLRFPLITVGILAAIHWQALRLWVKGHRARKKSEHPEQQTEKQVYLKPSHHLIH